MQLGIFAKTFPRPAFEQTFAAARACGLTCLQFNFLCAGLPTLPDSIESSLSQSIQAALQRHSLSMAAVSGTCNLIHPDPLQRSNDLSRLETLIRAARSISTTVVTLCTGTRDPSDMWRAHPGNRSTEAWKDLIKSLERILHTAQECDVVLGVEPEPANVIDSAIKARKLLDEVRSPWLKIVFDAANLIQPQCLEEQERVLRGAVDLLGPDIAIAHAKDVMPGVSLRHVAAGSGALNYAVCLSLLHDTGFDGPLILHGLQENEVPASVAFLNARLKSVHRDRASDHNALPHPRQN